MALNKQVFRQRSLTAIVFVVIMLAGLLINQWTFFLLFSFIHFGCWMEYLKMVGLIDKEYTHINPFHKYGVMIAGFSFMLWMLSDTYSIADFRLQEMGWWALVTFALVLPMSEVLLSKKNNPRLMGYSFIGLLYISLSWGLMMDLRNKGLYLSATKTGWWDAGVFLPLLVIGCMWVNDTMAYLVGSLIGKTPLSKISPKKTWEGTIGGIILCIIIMGYIGSKYVDVSFHIQGYHWYIIATLCAITGTAGDLLESKLKRLAGVKDSGSIMPGHGGFLDRFDSLILATPIVWLYIKLFVE
jgi:phosphatidate cytidylyltransferase